MANPIFGDENDNTITSGYVSDTIFGQGGNDILRGGYGADALYGGIGNDKLSGDQNNDTLSGDEGNDTLDGGTGADTLIGGAGTDKVLGGAGDDLMLAFSVRDASGDTFDGGSGVDTLFLSFGAATTGIRFTAKDPILVNQFGSFSITGVEQYQITGGSAADVITGYLLSDTLSGGKGNDTLKGLDGFDFLQGGDGADILSGGNDDDFVSGDTGNDVLNGDAGNDFVQGGTGADKINGGDGNDTLSSVAFSTDGTGDRTTEIDRIGGGKGDDFVEIGMKDIADGGAGFDTIQLDFRASGTAQNFVFSRSAITLAGGGSIQNFEVLQFFGGSARDVVTGGADNDGLHGGGGSDTLLGGLGNDLIDGDAGSDVVRGQDGNDVLTDSAGADKLYGDAGDDLFLTSASNVDPDIFDGGAGSDAVEFSSEGDLSGFLDLIDQSLNDGLLLHDVFKSVETFIGSEHDDFMSGNSSANTFYGSDGDDVLDGRAGNDVLHGGEGSDTFTGGAGKDIFDISDQELHGAWFGDIFTDFTRGEDKIRVSLEFLGLEEAPDFSIVSGQNPDPTVAGPQLLFDQVTHRLFFDQDGTGSEHEGLLIGTFENVNTLTVNDFIFS